MNKIVQAKQKMTRIAFNSMMNKDTKTISLDNISKVNSAKADNPFV